MTTPVEEFLVGKAVAVIGVSRSEEKYGTKVYRLLADHGYTVYGVNPNMSELDGRPVYSSLAALPVRVDGVVMVVPPTVAVNAIREAAQLGITRVWLQPGSESAAADAAAAELGVTLIRDTCIMLRSKAARAGQ